MKIKHIIAKMILRKNKDNEYVAQVKKNFAVRAHLCRYGLLRKNIESLVGEAAAGVMETVITELSTRKKNNSASLLNLGGGTGQMSSILEFIGFNVINLDIAIKSENAKNIKADLNTVAELPFPNKNFDFIVCQEVIEHLENPWALFRLVKTYMKPNGCFILTTPNIHSLASKNIFKKTNYFKWFCKKNLGYHINPLPFWELELVAKKTGFECLDLKGNADYFWGKAKEARQNVLNKNDILIYVFRAT